MNPCIFSGKRISGGTEDWKHKTHQELTVSCLIMSQNIFDSCPQGRKHTHTQQRGDGPRCAHRESSRNNGKCWYPKHARLHVSAGRLVSFSRARGRKAGFALYWCVLTLVLGQISRALTRSCCSRWFGHLINCCLCSTPPEERGASHWQVSRVSMFRRACGDFAVI